jgi:hypothetical protein
MIQRYLWNLLISIDQLGNTLLGGHPDETISSRCAKVITTCYACKAFCWLADKIDPNHCEKSIEHDEGRKIPVNK